MLSLTNFECVSPSVFFDRSLVGLVEDYELAVVVLGVDDADPPAGLLAGPLLVDGGAHLQKSEKLSRRWMTRLAYLMCSSIYRMAIVSN